jgi:hypothetical protein
MAFEVSTEVATGLITAILAALGTGKYVRSQKSDAAETKASVAESSSRESASKSLEIMQKQISELNTASIKTTNDINKLMEEIAKLRSGYIPAVMMLPTIKLCDICAPKHQDTLNYVITHLETMAPKNRLSDHDQEHDHGHNPV